MRILAIVTLTLLAGCSSDDSGSNAAGAGSQTSTAGGAPSTGTGGSAGALNSNGGDPAKGNPAGGSAGAGVGGTAGNTGDPGVACDEAGAAICARIAECSEFGLSVMYGDVDTCKARFVLECRAAIGAPGSSATAAKMQACAAAVPTQSCEELTSGNLGTVCSPDPGTLEDGSSCIDDAQCKSTFCARAGDAACGKCSPATSANDACVNGSCSRGLACLTASNTCGAPVRGKVGDSCTAQEECDLANAVGCNTLSKKCIPLTSAGEDETCGAKDLSGSSFAVCEAAGACSALLAGKCRAAAKDGEACSTDDAGPTCMLPARCVAGKCELPDSAKCD